jgi:hypothetical protein
LLRFDRGVDIAGFDPVGMFCVDGLLVVVVVVVVVAVVIHSFKITKEGRKEKI